MLIFYLFPFIPIIIGLILWIKTKTIIWQEWLASSVVAFILAGIMHAVAISGMTDDVETWSGQIVKARKFSAWQEYYEEAIYRTEWYSTTETYYTGTGSDRKRHTRRVRKSRRVFDHWEPRRRWHDTYWKMYSNIDTSYNIEQKEFSFLVEHFSNYVAVAGDRRTGEHNSRMIDGDKNDYESKPISGYIYPVTKLASFENKIKAAPTVFSYGRVSTNIPVYEWPRNPDFRRSQRLLGDASNKIDLYQWDRMNAFLGPLKQVNVIMVGFTNQPTIMGNYQESKWIGGKKNDFVICYNIDGNQITWVKVFSWTEQDICKRNVETIVLTNPINNSIIPLIEDEIRANFIRKDWHKFDYITIEPPTWSYIVYFVLMILTQCGLYIWFHMNDFKREDVQDIFDKKRNQNRNYY